MHFKNCHFLSQSIKSMTLIICDKLSNVFVSFCTTRLTHFVILFHCYSISSFVLAFVHKIVIIFYLVSTLVYNLKTKKILLLYLNITHNSKHCVIYSFYCWLILTYLIVFVSCKTPFTDFCWTETDTGHLTWIVYFSCGIK